MILITGGLGFIGSAFARHLNQLQEKAVILDAMTYAADYARIEGCQENIDVIEGDICDHELVTRLLDQYQPQSIVHFAAESHVDRSIDGPQEFLKTNVEGTMTLLKCATTYWSSLDHIQQATFRFLHVSTDEVYGSLEFDEPAFTENSSYQPNSPYSASKAASDHFVRAWHHTYQLPTLITHCSNNYGAWQYPEKLIPLMISKCLKGEPLPVYGNGSNIRDWIHVDDHVSALYLILSSASPGSVWGIGGETEKTNLQIVHSICDILDEVEPRKDSLSYREQISFVKDRPGHDVRYAINIKKIQHELKWSPSISFSEGLRNTISWYLSSHEWVTSVLSTGAYQQERLGLLKKDNHKKDTI